MNIIRTILERLSRGRIFRRKLPKEFGRIRMYVSPDVALSYLKFSSNSFDKELLSIVKTEVNYQTNIWDIGANVGLFSFAAAGYLKKGSFVLLEPDIWLCNLLLKTINSIEHNGQSFHVLPLAANNSNGIETLLIAKRGRASNALASSKGSTQMGGVREKKLVPTITLDTLSQFVPKPDFIKIDVEGSELKVLNGSTKILQEIRPKIYIEVVDELNKDITKIFKFYEYSLFKFDSSNNKRIPVDKCAYNTLACPNEKL
ncbi:MAG: FkbM family methyltransferase [Sphingobacteriaceae bacterium]|nr:FkbM family methyltransferase [Sphingobacteriaceae bacterium]